MRPAAEPRGGPGVGRGSPVHPCRPLAEWGPFTAPRPPASWGAASQVDASWPCPPRAPGLTLAHALRFEHVATVPVGTELGAIQLQHPPLRLVVQGDCGGGDMRWPGQRPARVPPPPLLGCP